MGDLFFNAEHSSKVEIKNGYARLLLYYRRKGVGKVSDISGVVITSRLIGAIEKRYIMLGGDLYKLYGWLASESSLNGAIKKDQ